MKLLSAAALFSFLLTTQAAPSFDAPPSLISRQDDQCMKQIWSCGWCHYFWNNKETPDGGPAKKCLIVKDKVEYWVADCPYCNKQEYCTGGCMEGLTPPIWTGEV